MIRSLQCTEYEDCNECASPECDCSCHPWTWERFVDLTRAHADMMQQAESRTDQIMKRMKHRGGLKKADEYGAVIEYNNDCHCHPTWKEFTIPAEWLFAEDWEAKVDEYMRGLEAKRLAAEAEIDKLRQSQERKDYERLKYKYEVNS
jgi:hypothetical protein